MPKKKKIKRIKKANITHISLCPKGANGMQTLFKSDQSSFNDMRNRVQGLITEKYPKDEYIWIRDMFTDFVVYEAAGKLYRIGYNLTENTLVGEPVEVAERTQYFEINTLEKSDMEEEGVIYGIVYAPNMVDSQNDFASPEVVRDMMYSFAKEGKGVDIMHDFEALSKEDAYVVEQFLVQKGDPRFEGLKDYEGNEVDATGSWAVAIKVDNEDLKKKYREGEWQGLSMGGEYMTEEVEEDEEVGLVKKLFNMLVKEIGFGASQKPKKEQEKEEPEMDSKELVEALKEANKPLHDELKTFGERLEKLEELQTPAGSEGNQPPAGGDPEEVDLTDPKAVQKLVDKLEKEQLRKSVDINDLDALKEHLETLAKKEDNPKPSSVQTVTKASKTAEKAAEDRMVGFNGGE